MKPNDEPSDEEFEQTLGGLEQLARGFDARRYPGQAWPAARVWHSRRFVWKIVGSAGIAAMVAVALHLWVPPPQICWTVRNRGSIVRARPPTTAPAKSTMPRIIIIEDVDSYSIIDLNNNIPLVSFASKDSPSLDDMVPILLDPSLNPGL